MDLLSSSSSSSLSSLTRQSVPSVHRRVMDATQHFVRSESERAWLSPAPQYYGEAHHEHSFNEHPPLSLPPLLSFHPFSTLKSIKLLQDWRERSSCSWTCTFNGCAWESSGPLAKNFLSTRNEDKWSFVWCKNLDRFFFRFVTMHAFDRRTDGRTDRQTDRILIARPCLHCM